MTHDSQQVRRALNSGQFVPFFQPIVAVRTGKLAGFEVLARWDHPEVGLIAPAGFSLRRTVIEITESALAENPTQAYATVSALKEWGCRIALDDFGTGYSSLLQLQSTPFDELKVDQSFVSSMTERRDSRKIVAAVVGMGQSLGLTTGQWVRDDEVPDEGYLQPISTRQPS